MKLRVNALIGLIALLLFGVSVVDRADASSGNIFGRNLVVNPGFEDTLGSLDIDHIVKPTDWSTDGYATILQYGGFDGLPTTGDHDESIKYLGGRNFFAGGPGRQNEVAKAWQRIDLIGAKSMIRRGKAHYELAASLGGRSAKADFAKVWVRFFDAGKHQLAAPLGISPVFRAERRGKTRFIRHACSDLVPAGARYVQVSVGAYKLTGSDNHGYVDDVSFILRYGHDQTRDMSRCIASSTLNSSELLASARQIDDGSYACVNNEHLGLSFLAGFITFLLLLAVMFGDDAKYQERTLGFRRYSKTFRVWNGAGRGFRIAAESAAIVFLIALLMLWRLQALSYAECGLRETLAPQPWTFYPAIFCLLVAFDSLAATIVFIHWNPLHPARRWRSLAIRASIFLTAALVALVVLAWRTPTADQLDRFTTVLLILAVPLSYMWLALRESIRSYRKELKWGIAFLLVLPIVQPMLALWNIHAIETQRIHHELEHRFFDVDIDREHVRFTGVLFYAPTALDYRESGRVLFSARVSGGTDKSRRSCLVPRFSAPGFETQQVVEDAVPLTRNDVRWEWIVSPKRDGRQSFFVDILYSPSCRHSNSTGGSSPDGFTLLSNQTDSAWVSRQWFSVEDLSSALPWITLFGALITLVVGVLDIREHAGTDAGRILRP